MRRQAAFSLKLLQKVCWPRTGTIGRGSVRAGQPLTPNTCTAPVGSGRRPKAADRVKRDAVAAVETRRGSRISTRPPLPKINDSKNAAMVSEAVHSPLPSRPPSPVSVYLGHFSFPVRRRFEARSSPRLCSSVRVAKTIVRNFHSWEIVSCLILVAFTLNLLRWPSYLNCLDRTEGQN